jgi:hypothetical protein
MGFEEVPLGDDLRLQVGNALSQARHGAALSIVRCIGLLAGDPATPGPRVHAAVLGEQEVHRLRGDVQRLGHGQGVWIGWHCDQRGLDQFAAYEGHAPVAALALLGFERFEADADRAQDARVDQLPDFIDALGGAELVSGNP